MAPAREESNDEDALEADVAEEPHIKVEPEDNDDSRTTGATVSLNGDDGPDEGILEDVEDVETAAAPPSQGL